MKKKLFVVCPFSCMEPFLRSNFCDDIYFLSSPASILDIDDSRYMESISEFIYRKEINTVYFVNDTACKFLNRIIKREELYGLFAEIILDELYFDYYTSQFKRQPLHEQQFRLAELSIKKQVSEIMRSEILGTFIHEQNIDLKGLITTKSKKYFKEIVFNPLDSTIYEF
ncbi:MAG: hypothetical protein ACK5AO_09430 [bacterium]|jgi:carbonic anhydrase